MKSLQPRLAIRSVYVVKSGIVNLHVSTGLLSLLLSAKLAFVGGVGQGLGGLCLCCGRG